MPMRAYRASTAAYKSSVGHASAHIAGNLVAWMIVCALVTAGAAYLCARPVVGDSSSWGHVAAVAAMFLGILVMIRAEGSPAPTDGPRKARLTHPAADAS
jgi:hypothetical protein